MTNVRGETEGDPDTEETPWEDREMRPLAEGQHQPPGTSEAGTDLPLRRQRGPALMLNV